MLDIGESLLQLHKWYNMPLDGVKSSKPTSNNFYQLTMDEKVDILYTLMENIMDNPGSEVGELCRSGDVEFKVGVLTLQHSSHILCQLMSDPICSAIRVHRH
jgi:hypothetical protein